MPSCMWYVSITVYSSVCEYTCAFMPEINGLFLPESLFSVFIDFSISLNQMFAYNSLVDMQIDQEIPFLSLLRAGITDSYHFLFK